MKNNGQTTRRSFLSSLAILSAGAAFGSATDFVSVGKTMPDLQKQWNHFWKEQGGQLFHETIQLKDNAIINPCKGHFYKRGKVIYFPNANILAQPTWIYWGIKRAPSDVVITFLKNDPGMEKILRINRFELDGICVLSEDIDKKEWTPIMNEAVPLLASHEYSGWKLKVKTRITKWRKAQIHTTISNQVTAIEKKLFYHI